MINFQKDDIVEVDRLGLPHHGAWGVVKKVENLEVWVRLVNYAKAPTGQVLGPLVKVEPWELRLLGRKES